MRRGDLNSYVPDFTVKIDDGHGPDDLLNLIVEVSGAGRRDKATKVATIQTMWVPAANGTGTFGRWDYVEVRDPWEARTLIRRHLAATERACMSFAPSVSAITSLASQIHARGENLSGGFAARHIEATGCKTTSVFVDTTRSPTSSIVPVTRSTSPRVSAMGRR
jgi:hypothetical protein